MLTPWQRCLGWTPGGGGRLISLDILTPFCTIFFALWGSNLMGPRGGAIFGVFGLIVGLELGYVLAQRFIQFLAVAIVGIKLWIAGFFVWLMPDTREQCTREASGDLFGIIDSARHSPH